MRSGTMLQAAVVMTSVAVTLPIAGCKHHEEAPVVEPGVTREQLLADGERLIREGQSLRRRGMDLRQSQSGGGEDLIIRGEQMIVEGERRKDKAMMMPPTTSPATAPQPTRPAL